MRRIWLTKEELEWLKNCLHFYVLNKYLKTGLSSEDILIAAKIHKRIVNFLKKYNL